MSGKARLLGSLCIAALIGLGSVPAMAIDLGGAVGNVTDAVTGGSSGGTGNAASGAVDSVTGGGSAGGGSSSGNGVLSLSNTKVLSPNEAATATAKSDLLNGIYAKIDVLNKDDLLQVCASVGGGSGCSSGTEQQLLGLITSRIGLLSNTSLASLCVSVGADGCGGGIPGGVGGVVGGVRNPGATFASLSDEDKAALRIKCIDVIKRPASYEANLVAICRLIRR